MNSATTLQDVTLVSGDFVKTGGMDRANYALAEYLSGLGCSVELVAHRVASELERARGVSFRKVPKPFGSYMLGEPFLDLAGRSASRAVRRRHGVSVANGGNCVGPRVNWVHYVHAAYRAPSSGGARALVSSLHGYRARERERAALAIAKLVICNSARTRLTLIDALGVAPERAFVVYYGMDADQFGPVTPERATEARIRLGWPERPTVAFVGALGDRRKGFDTVFSAWSELCRDPSWDANVVAIGAGAEVEVWRERARACGLEERVRLLGFRSDVHAVLAGCDAMVAPTRYEAFGLAVAEAIAMGLPTFVSESAGVAELYPENVRDHLLLDPESASELARRLRSWRGALPERRARFADFSAVVRGRSWPAMAGEIAVLIEKHAL